MGDRAMFYSAWIFRAKPGDSLTQGKVGDPDHDRTAPERLKAMLY
jgi:hypothetical protein